MEIKPTSNISHMSTFYTSSEAHRESIKRLLGQILSNATRQLVGDIDSELLGRSIYHSIGDEKIAWEQFIKNEEPITSLVYRSYFAHTSKVISDLEKAHRALAHSGNIVIQEINFSEVNCFPFNFAMGRFKNLYIEVCNRSGYDYKIGLSLPRLMGSIGFSDIECSYLPPIFLKKQRRNLISHLINITFQSAMAYNLIVKEEKLALSAEISNYLKDDNNLVSLPGVFQIKASK